MRAPKHQRGSSPEIKGVFTDSVIAQLPEVPVEEDAVGQLFAADARMPAPSLSPAKPVPPPPRAAAHWHEPGSTMQGHLPAGFGRPASKPLPSGAGASRRGASLQGGVAAPSRPIKLPAGAVGGPTSTIGGAIAPRPGDRKPGFPAGTVRSGAPEAGALEAIPSAATEAEAAAQQTNTFEFDSRPSGLDLDIPIDLSSLRAKPAVSLAPGSATAMRAAAHGTSMPVAVPSEVPSDRPGAHDSLDPDAPASGRPKSAKERRAEARRTARRKAAKHLPPLPSTPPKTGWDPARITLVVFAAVLALGAAALAAAEAGLWSLPPRAAAMLGLGGAQASLERTKRAATPNLVMPKAVDVAQPALPAPAALPLQPLAAAPEPPPQQEAVAPQPPAAAAPTPAAPEEPSAEPGATMRASAAEPIPRPPTPVAPAPEPAAPTVAEAAEPEAPEEVEPGDDESESIANGPTAQGDDATLVALARAKLRARDAAGAAEMMLRVATQNPDDHHAMEVLVRAWIALGRGKDAVRYAEQIVKKRPKRAAYRVLLGDALLTTGDTTRAQAAWHAALELEPNNREAKRRLGGK